MGESSITTSVMSPAPGGEEPAPTPAPAPTPWTDGFDEASMEYVGTKGWTSPNDLLKSYRNVESFAGGSKKLVEIPGEGSDAEVMGEFYDRLGRPMNAESYGIEFDDNTKGDVEQFTAMAYENGLTRDQARAMYASMTEQGEQLQQQSALALEQSNKNAINDLRDQWGRDYDKHISAGQDAFRRLGIDEETIESLEGSLGSKAVIEMFSKIGARMGEPEFIDGKSSESYGMSANQARLKIAELKADHVWLDRYLDGDPAANEQMKTLMEIGNG